MKKKNSMGRPEERKESHDPRHRIGNAMYAERAKGKLILDWMSDIAPSGGECLIAKRSRGTNQFQLNEFVDVDKCSRPASFLKIFQ